MCQLSLLALPCLLAQHSSARPRPAPALQCSADGTQHCHNFGCPPGADDEGDEAAVDGWLQDAGAASSSAGYSEVHMILRMPRAAPPQQVQPAAGPYGTAEEMEALIEQLRGELSLKEQQRQAAVEAYMRRVRLRLRPAMLGASAVGSCRTAGKPRDACAAPPQPLRFACCTGGLTGTS